MRFDHEKLQVYEASLELAAFVDNLVRLPSVGRVIRDQISRASISIPLNIAEGNGKRSPADRMRFFEIARGSAMECAAALDVLVACKQRTPEQVEPAKVLLWRIVSMLTRLINVSPDRSRVREDDAPYPAHVSEEGPVERG